MYYSDLLKNLKKGKIEKVYYFSGEEKYLKTEALEKLKSLLIPKKEQVFNLDKVYAGKTPLDKILNLVQMHPLGFEKRLVVVNEVNKLNSRDKDLVLKHLNFIPDSTFLVFLSDKKDAKTKFATELKKLKVQVVEFNPLNSERVRFWILERIKFYGKSIEKDALELLHNLCGENLFDLAQQIEKLVLFIGDKSRIEMEDVEKVVGFSKIHNVFQLSNAVGEKDFLRSVEILKNLSLYGEKPGTMLFFLTRHWIRLLKIKNFQPRKQSLSLASYLGVHPFYLKDYQKQKTNFTQRDLEKGILHLFKAECDLKTSRMPSDLVLEILIYNLCNL
jgi:DNA polymerase-3 subunit delta